MLLGNTVLSPPCNVGSKRYETPRNAVQVRFEGIDTTLDCGGEEDNMKDEQSSVEGNDEMESGDSETEGACTDRPTTR